VTCRRPAGARTQARALAAACAAYLLLSFGPGAAQVPAPDPWSLFADSLVAALNERDSVFVTGRTDSSVFGAALQAADDLPEAARAYVNAIAAGVRELGSVVLQEVPPGTAFAVVRVEPGGDSGRTVLCRMHGEQMLAYVRIALVMRDGRVMIADWHNLATGVSVRESLRFWMDALDADASGRAGGGRRTGSVAALFVKLRAGDAAGAADELRRLPRKTVEHPMVVAARIAAARSSDAESRGRLFGWLARSPRRARRYPLLLVDYFMSQDDYRRALRATANVERAVGPEAGVACLRAAIYGASGRTDAAYRAFAAAIELDPSFEAAYWRLLDLLVADGEFADATLVLDVLAAKFEYDFDIDEFSEVESYRAFVRSTEFRQWAREWEQ